MLNVEEELSKAVQHFWKTRESQHNKQGTEKGKKDAGSRGAVTGGKHADGFVNLIASIVSSAGLSEFNIHFTKKRPRTLPGYFRPCKEWDVLVVVGTDLVAAVEVKSQVGSFGNNFNNRVEEALGNAMDFWEAYKHGRFEGSGQPWLGYLFMLEENEDSTTPTRRVDLQPFKVDELFQERSYAQRYEEVCKRLIRERAYNAACFFSSNRVDGAMGRYHEASDPELSIKNFAISLYARAAAFQAVKE